MGAESLRCRPCSPCATTGRGDFRSPTRRDGSRSVTAGTETCRPCGWCLRTARWQQRGPCCSGGSLNPTCARHYRAYKAARGTHLPPGLQVFVLVSGGRGIRTHEDASAPQRVFKIELALFSGRATGDPAQRRPPRHPAGRGLMNRYRSGWCGNTNHARCTGTYAGAACTCTCPCHSRQPHSQHTATLASRKVSSSTWSSGPTTPSHGEHQYDLVPPHRESWSPQPPSPVGGGSFIDDG